MIRRVYCSVLQRRFLRQEYQKVRTLYLSSTRLNCPDVESKDIILRSSLPDFEIPEMRIEEYIWHNINKWSRKVATIDGITGRQYTYGQLRDKCRILAIRLYKNFNLQIGDRIAICLPNCPEYPIIVLAGLEAGMVNTTINPLYNAG